VAAVVTRVLDRPGERRIIATAASGEALEFDVEPERDVLAGEAGFVTLRRAKVFSV
jgi:sulfate transport system ATP-binding protein